MPLGQHKKKWEIPAIVAIATVMGVSFIYVTARILTASPSRPAAGEAAGVTEEGGQPAGEPSREDRRFYRRLLTMHESDSLFSNPRELLTPTYATPSIMPAGPVRPPSSILQERDLFASLPSMRQPSTGGDAGKDGDEKFDTGWGWLANDIAEGRRNRERTGDEPMRDRRDDGRAADDFGERDLPGRRDATTAGRGRGETTPSSIFDRTGETASRDRDSANMDLRPVMRDIDGSWRDRAGADSMGDSSLDEARRESAREMDFGGRPPGADDSFGRGLVMRDPFAGEGSFGGGSFWRAGAGDAFSGSREREAAGMSGSAVRPEVDLTRVSPSAGSFAGIGSSPGFSSESFFSTPAALDGTRSDALFSGSSMFEGGSSFGSPAMAPPAPMDSGSRFNATERSGPGALPW